MNYAHAFRRPLRASAAGIAVAALAFGAAACGSDEGTQASSSGLTLTNCGEEVSYPGVAKKLLINDGNIASLALAVGAADEITAVSSMASHLPVLTAAYGDAIAQKPEVAKEYPNLEQVIAAEPDVMLAGWGYGFSEDKGITPESLSEHGIGAYTLTESCRTGDAASAGKEGSGDPGHTRGLVDPWEAVKIDLKNIATLTGHDGEGDKVIADIDNRLQALDAAPKGDKKPVGFLFDSVGEAPFTSGSFGAPQGILEKAGATNAAESIKDTWTTTSWEHVAEMNPDFIALVDYPGQTFEEKIKVLRTNPATKDLEAVKENRFINLPIALWTESPLNVDAAEYVRKALEEYGLVPASEVTTKMELPSELPGQEYLQK